ncbi:MAG TPA: complex I NDUFA9 subunit family protein [Caldimonas sp.]|nr:complex I NDUFA9 subunit family protein [Caldimonas sp.]
MLRKFLILGGTGFVGRSICEKLVERSGGAEGRIRVATRRFPRARHLQLLPTLEIACGDVHDEAALARMLRDTDAVINLVAILHGSAADFERVHVRLPARLAAACQAAGVRRVVHVSALGTAVDAPSRYLRSKARGEEALKAVAALDLTILRPSVIFGERDRFLNLFALLQSIFPVMPLAGAQARFQPVWVDDVASAVVRSLDDPTTTGTTIECCGPRVYTLEALVRLAGEWSGSRRPVLALPAALGRLQALAMELLPGTPLMSRDNIDSMRVANVASGKLPGLERLGIEPTPLEAIAPRYLGHVSGEKRLEAWRARARRI